MLVGLELEARVGAVGAARFLAGPPGRTGGWCTDRRFGVRSGVVLALVVVEVFTLGFTGFSSLWFLVLRSGIVSNI